jgi:hypothetical protein
MGERWALRPFDPSAASQILCERGTGRCHIGWTVREVIRRWSEASLSKGPGRPPPTVIGRTTPLLPERVRYMPIAYRARQAARARQRLERALAGRPM